MNKNIEFKERIEKTEKYVMWFSILGMLASAACIAFSLQNLGGFLWQ